MYSHINTHTCVHTHIHAHTHRVDWLWPVESLGISQFPSNGVSFCAFNFFISMLFRIIPTTETSKSCLNGSWPQKRKDLAAMSCTLCYHVTGISGFYRKWLSRGSRGMLEIAAKSLEVTYVDCTRKKSLERNLSYAEVANGFLTRYLPYILALFPL